MTFKYRHILLFFALLFSTFIVNGQIEMYQSDRVLSQDSSMSVRKTYKSVKISKQVWMLENLNVSHYRNGDSIPEARTEEEWKKCLEEEKGCWCNYQNNLENGYKYGKLYNWYAVTDPRGLAPKGWHVPSVSEWEELIISLGGKMEAGGKMKSTNDWGKNCNANNQSGFFGLPGGLRSSEGQFMSINDYATWWTTSEYKGNMAYYIYLYCSLNFAIKYYYTKGDGFSVRCIKD